MKRVRILPFLLIPAIAWLGYAILAKPIALLIASHWGARILRLGDGKFSDVPAFLQHRFYEAAWLVTVTLALVAAALLLAKAFAPKVPPLWRWVPYTVTGFVALNVWLQLAGTTCLFWGLFWNGKGTTDNLAQFQMKLLLTKEATAPIKVALAGSSQMHVQIDHRLLNRRLGSNFFSMDLDFPSSRAYDFLFLDRQLRSRQADVIVCYLSELNFFSGALSDGFWLFFSWGDLPEFLRLGGKPQWSSQKLAYGLLGDLLPLFRLRDCLSERVLGLQLTSLRQRARDASLEANLQQRAVEAARGYKLDDQSQFSFAAFEKFVALCRAERRTVVLCCGQLNPILERQLDPGLRPKMIEFLRSLAAKYQNVVLLEENQLPAQSPQDYVDLTHVAGVAQVRFTEAIAHVLEKTSPR